MASDDVLSAPSIGAAIEAGSNQYGPCPTRASDTPSRRPWHYLHAASIEGLHWDVYAGEGVDGWLVASVDTEDDARLIVDVVNAHQPQDQR